MKMVQPENNFIDAFLNGDSEFLVKIFEDLRSGGRSISLPLDVIDHSISECKHEIELYCMMKLLSSNSDVFKFNRYHVGISLLCRCVEEGYHNILRILRDDFLWRESVFIFHEEEENILRLYHSLDKLFTSGASLDKQTTLDLLFDIINPSHHPDILIILVRKLKTWGLNIYYILHKYVNSRETVMAIRGSSTLNIKSLSDFRFSGESGSTVYPSLLYSYGLMIDKGFFVLGRGRSMESDFMYIFIALPLEIRCAISSVSMGKSMANYKQYSNKVLLRCFSYITSYEYNQFISPLLIYMEMNMVIPNALNP